MKIYHESTIDNNDPVGLTCVQMKLQKEFVFIAFLGIIIFLNGCQRSEETQKGQVEASPTVEGAVEDKTVGSHQNMDNQQEGSENMMQGGENQTEEQMGEMEPEAEEARNMPYSEPMGE
ncbi:MAG: hypothetical protein NZT61_05090 [Deltaproteobacteria bacterium]|nr:hypothetical protein [Deltaproteobacteria bacterium]MCX7952649.1 hypothetical protein [Deltaproteobacteria bacterium]